MSDSESSSRDIVRSLARGFYAIAIVESLWALAIASGVEARFSAPVAIAASLYPSFLRWRAGRGKVLRAGRRRLLFGAIGLWPAILMWQESAGGSAFGGLVDWMTWMPFLLMPGMVILSWLLARRGRPLWLLLGAILGHVVLAWLAVPRFGWLQSVTAAFLAWILIEWTSTRAGQIRIREWTTSLSEGVLHSLWSLIGGVSLSVLGIGILEHVPSHASITRVLVLAALIAVGAGWLLGDRLARLISPRWLFACWPLLAFALWSSARMLLVSAPSAVGAPWQVGDDAEPAVFELAAAAALWILAGFPLVVWGLGLAQFRRVSPWDPGLALSGFVLGICLASLLLVPFLNESGDGKPSFAWEMTPKRPLETVEVATAYPLGIAALRRARGWLEHQAFRTWRGEIIGRDSAWGPLEELEVRLPWAALGSEQPLEVDGSLTAAHWRVIGESRRIHVGIDPVPLPEPSDELHWRSGQSMMQFIRIEDPRPAVFVSGHHGSGTSLDRTPGLLRYWKSELPEEAVLWVWSDARSFRSEGLRSLLTGWKNVFPDATLWILQDRFAGPLIGLQIGGRELPADFAADHVLARGAVRELVVIDGPTPSWNRPLLEWGYEMHVPMTPYPRAATLRALRESLKLSGAAEGLFEGLARHAESQVRREMVQDELERITFHASELEAWAEGLSRDPDCEPLGELCIEVARFLLEKDQYEILVPWLEEVSSLRPSSFGMHLALGRTYAEILDPEGAAEELSLALALAGEPESDQVAALKAELARSLGEAGRWREAKDLLEEVWARGTDLRIAKALGLAYLELEQYEEAESFLGFAREEAPNDEEIRAAWERLEEERDR
ncbi:MAG: hypothetical protein RL885_08975 [Planctomycetota bacterium]